MASASKKEALKNISFKVDPDLHTKYRLVCVANRKEMKTEFIKFMEREIVADERKKAKQK